MNKLNKEIRMVIAELEEEFREDGDNESGDEMKRILESPNQVASLHGTFSRKLPRICETDTSLFRSRRYGFFADFKSTDGTALSDDQVSNLVSFTTHWELTEESVGALEEKIGVADPSKWKVFMLVMLSRKLQHEQETIHMKNIEQSNRESSRPTKRRRIEDDDDGDCNRDAVFLSLCISLYQLWIHIDEDAATQQRESLSKDPLSGWTSIEFQALNAFVGVLPQSSIMLELLLAWKSITSCYRGKSDALLEKPQSPDLQSEDSGATPEGNHERLKEIQREVANPSQPRSLMLLNSGFTHEPPTPSASALLYKSTWNADRINIQAPVAGSHRNGQGDAELTDPARSSSHSASPTLALNEDHLKENGPQPTDPPMADGLSEMTEASDELTEYTS